MLTRRGASLVELLVALALAAIVFAVATSSVLRQQRTHARIAAVAASNMQLAAGTTLLSTQLAFVDVSAGDLTMGEAQDTALQLRATIAFAIQCDSAVARATFLPDPSNAVPHQGIASQPRVGDTLWFLADTAWKGARIAGVSQANVACPAPFATTGSSLRLTLSGLVDTIPAGAPLRVTRPTRYAFYRAGDGTWQLGFREWSEASGSFSAPQPIAGPFVRSSAGHRSRFRYFDSSGEELTGPGIERSVSRIRIHTYALTGAYEAAYDTVRADSTDVALQRAIVR